MPNQFLSSFHDSLRRVHPVIFPNVTVGTPPNKLVATGAPTPTKH